MAKAIIDEQNLTDIADAIRAKNGSADTYTPSEMATAISNLPSGSTPAEQEVYEITAETTCTNTSQCKQWVDSLIAEHTGSWYMAYIIYLGTLPVNNQFLLAIHYSNSSPTGTINYQNSISYRYNSGAIRGTPYNNAAYDSKVNIGDHYRLVLIKAELIAT